ncbi:hypothetical protein G6F32_016594 [Rhizopus arrhizus]|nr:hypothetical protein G6F32_016594 [Rhizopus arrhizus]
MSGTIKSTVVVASVAFTAAGGSLAIGASVAENDITQEAGARATLSNTQVANLGAINVTADTIQTLETVVVAGAHARRDARPGGWADAD